MLLRKAKTSDQSIIWTILQQAIERRRRDGSKQWQNGYPNQKVVAEDISKGYGYVLEVEGEVIAYAAIIFGIEPAYNDLKGGQWLSAGDYVVVHRVATADSATGKRIGTQLFKMIENLAIEKEVYSIKVDTNFDNIAMLRILENLNYTYCGEVFFEGPRRAYEKLLAR